QPIQHAPALRHELQSIGKRRSLLTRGTLVSTHHREFLQLRIVAVRAAQWAALGKHGRRQFSWPVSGGKRDEPRQGQAVGVLKNSGTTHSVELRPRMAKTREPAQRWQAPRRPP